MQNENISVLLDDHSLRMKKILHIGGMLLSEDTSQDLKDFWNDLDNLETISKDLPFVSKLIAYSGEPLEECDDDQRCDILCRSLMYGVDDPESPVEWQYDKEGNPLCTAFVDASNPIPALRCDKTIDMFQEAA